MTDFLRLNRIHKSFAGVYALKGVDFSIKPGEIHCLVGENGSGKSTLIKIISGVYQPDQGSIFLEGKQLEHSDSASTKKRGIEVIYQDLSLFPNLTVAENIAFSQIKEGNKKIVDWKMVKKIAGRAMDRIQVKIDPAALVGDLPIGSQQLVAICRALIREDVKMLILDEPTASLTKADIDNLLKIIHGLQSQGMAVLFVSHKLDEVFDVAERITILRDGATVATLPSSELDNNKLVSLMTGQEVHGTKFEPEQKDTSVVLEVKNLSKTYNFKNISFKLCSGEILGISGLIGSGRTELANALYGISPAETGEIIIDGQPKTIRNVQDAVKAGIAYVPENRLSQGLFLNQSVGDNMVAAVLKTLVNKFGFIDRSRKKEKISDWVSNLMVKVADPVLEVQTLSGGNQQKVVIGKCLATEPKILILDGPTVGIDVMAKNSIHEKIRELANGGVSVILISDELSEVINNSNRLLLMRSGKIVSEHQSSEVTEVEIEEIIASGKTV